VNFNLFFKISSELQPSISTTSIEKSRFSSYNVITHSCKTKTSASEENPRIELDIRENEKNLGQYLKQSPHLQQGHNDIHNTYTNEEASIRLVLIHYVIILKKRIKLKFESLFLKLRLVLFRIAR
jgi:hypothetical protein